MSFAYVFVHRQTPANSRRIVRTENILKFDTDSFVCEDKVKRSQQIYSLSISDGKLATCQVLAIADNAVDIEKLSQSKRFHVPKLSVSIVDQFAEKSSSDTSDSEKEKQKRKRHKKEQAKSSKEAEKEITKKYKRINSVYDDSDNNSLEDEDYEAEGSEVLSPIRPSTVWAEPYIDNPVFSSSVIKNQEATHKTGKVSRLISPVKTVNQSAPSISKKLVYDENTENSNSKTSSMSNKVQTEELLKAQNEAKSWKKKYFDLLDSQAYPLTERTGQKLIDLLEQSSSEVNESNNVSSRKKSENEVSVSRCAENEPARVVPDDDDDDDNKTIVKELLSKSFRNAGECAKSITRHLWTDEELETRVVRRVKGNNKKILTPSKTVRARNIFRKWLKAKDYGKDARNMEMNSLSGYMGRVIENVARSKKRQLEKKEVENPDAGGEKDVEDLEINRQVDPLLDAILKRK
ncbi:centromere protein C-like [Aphidius gifuensis]|uniref:centromere protein C-like n=1 Tax=Aphidius gifuensis TaxID=684658 RepID=UPI001CDBB617|nr:centromere protein C-like [Aphidius gifuensis]